MSAEVVSRLCTALGDTNTHLKELHMAATNLTTSMVEPFILALQVNHTLEVLNLESNFITGKTSGSRHIPKSTPCLAQSCNSLSN